MLTFNCRSSTLDGDAACPPMVPMSLSGLVTVMVISFVGRQKV